MNSGPIPHHVLIHQFSDVNHPEQKIKYHKSKGELQLIVRGLYLNKDQQYSKFNIANILYGPSYVTGLTLLSWMGWISERITTVQSATIKRGKTIDTFLGRFEYFHLDKEIFHLGIERYSFGEGMSCVLATPTKALYDHIIMTSHLEFTGKDDLRYYLEDELRMDTELLSKLDIDLLDILINKGKKRRQLRILKNLVKAFL